MTSKLVVDQESPPVGTSVTFSVLYPIQGAPGARQGWGAANPSAHYTIRLAAGAGAQEYPPTGTPLLDVTQAADTSFLLAINPGDITGGVPVSAWLLTGSTVIAGTLFRAVE